MLKVIIDRGRLRTEIVLEDVLNKLTSEQENKSTGCLAFIENVMREIKGKVDPSIPIEEIWSDKELREKANVDKLSFGSLMHDLEIVEAKLKEEKKQYILKETLESQNRNNLAQLIYSIDESVLEEMLNDILGDKYSRDRAKKQFLETLLVKFDFILMEGRQKFGDNKKATR